MGQSNVDRQEAISPAQLMKLLKVPMSRLRRWNENGVFGDDYKKRGHGVTRLYGFDDAVLGLIHKHILDLTLARKMEITLGEDFIRTFRQYIAVQFPAEIKREEHATDAMFLTQHYYDTPAVVEIHREDNHWVAMLHQVTSGRKTLGFPTGIASLLIRLDLAVAEVLDFFKREGALLPRYLQE